MDEIVRRQIGEELRRLRLKSNLTLDEVGAKIDRSAKSVQLYETSTVTISLEIFVKLCKVYNTTPGAFLDKVVK